MFTGIVTGIGHIVELHHLGASPLFGKRLAVSCPPGYLADVSSGDSVALNGACMTATTIQASEDRFDVEVSAESLRCTSGLDAPGPVNLEKALRAQERLGGHIVSGHVDGVGVVSRFEQVGESWLLCILAPVALAKFLAVKGSAAVNGVSLTINQVSDDAVLPNGLAACEIGINLIAHTLQHTTLGHLTRGARVNLEIDLIARYVERMLALQTAATS
jgi:riboflavin synthase